MGRRYGLGNNGGKGFAYCDASGLPVRAQDRIKDVRQGVVDKDNADWSGPKFGTYHPADLYDVGKLDDPSDIYEARTGDLDREMATPVEGLEPIDWPGDWDKS